MADHHDVVGGGREPAPTPVGDPSLGQDLSTFELEVAEFVFDGVDDGGLGGGAHAAASSIRLKACSKSALMSSMCSIPTETRMRSALTPDASCS